MDSREASTYGKRGRAALTAQYKYNVEGEYLTARQISERTGMSIKKVRYRCAKRVPLKWENFRP